VVRGYGKERSVKKDSDGWYLLAFGDFTCVFLGQPYTAIEMRVGRDC
jgi:hypothetical protein